MTQTLAKNDLSLNLNKLKGHMTIKSSALCPEPCKLEKQFITAQNMASHYKRVLNVRSSIDSTPPKSMIQSQKARDRVKREKSINKSIRSRPSSVDVSARKENLYDSKSLEQYRQSVDLTRSSTSLSRTSNHNNAARMSIDSTTTNQMQKTFLMSQSLLAERLFSELTNPSLRAMSKLVAGKNYDVLDNHKKFFKQPTKDFEPRIKNRKAESTIKDKPYYNPPSKPKRKPKTKGNDSEAEANNNTSKQLDTRRSYSPFSDRSTERTERPKNAAEIEEIKKKVVVRESLKVAPQESSKPPIVPKENLIKKNAEKEEEIRYLNFIKDVTDDIIARGVTTNRVINNIFEYHINKSKNILKESKMRDLLSTLRKDLGMPLEEATNLDYEYSPSINKALIYDAEKQQEKPPKQSENYSIFDKFESNIDKDKLKGSYSASKSPKAIEPSKPRTKIKDDIFNSIFNDDGETSKSITLVTETIIDRPVEADREKNKKSNWDDQDSWLKDDTTLNVKKKEFESKIFNDDDSFETPRPKSPIVQEDKALSNKINNDDDDDFEVKYDSSSRKNEKPFDEDQDDPLGKTQRFFQDDNQPRNDEKDLFNYNFGENENSDDEDDDKSFGNKSEPKTRGKSSTYEEDDDDSDGF